MLKSIKIKNLVFLLTLSIFIQAACSSKKTVRYLKSPIVSPAKIAVIIDSPNNLKNVVIARFLSKGYRIAAINASDLYTINDIFNLKDLKKLSYDGDIGDSLVNMERTYNNIYKLHLYNYELNKAEFLDKIRNKYNVKYVVLLDLKNWEDTSWGRGINLTTYEVIWVDNYPTKYSDGIEEIVDHFIVSLAGK